MKLCRLCYSRFSFLKLNRDWLLHSAIYSFEVLVFFVFLCVSSVCITSACIFYTILLNFI